MIKTLELPIGELKYALTGLAKVISTKASLPILRHVRVEPDGNDAVCLHATDLDAFVTCRIPAKNIDGFTACTVAFEPLNKLLKTSKGDLALVQENDGKVNIRYAVGTSTAKAAIESLAVAEWPTLPVMTSATSKLDDAFKPALRQALECSSADSSRHVLQGACLDVGQADCHTIVATDARHLFAANTFTFPLSGSVIVPDHKFLNWSGFAEDGNWHLAVELDPQKEPLWVKLQSDRWTFIVKAISGNYPNWRPVVPSTEGKSRIGFSPEAVATILDTLPCLPTWNDDLPVLLENVNGQLCLKGHGKDTEEWTQVPVPAVKLEGDPFSITLNRTFLSKALRFGFTDLDVYSERDPMRFTAPGRKLVVVPLTYPGMEPQKPATETAPETTGVSAPSAVTAQPTTEERKIMPAKTPESPLKEAVEQIEKIKETLRTALNDCSTVLAAIRTAEKEKKATEKEVEGVRTTLRSLQKVTI